jgi:hypothetical protein
VTDDGEMIFGAAAVAKFLRVSRRHVQDLVRDQGLPVHLLGKQKVATRRQLIAWLESRPVSVGSN